ncbi:ribulose-phosphate 3-epimerase [Candidatus Pacearchaeota archaeon]|nr:ribulose-phosphate 3-epimerase [Candidatus Pacearchaeota archaeon]
MDSEMEIMQQGKYEIIPSIIAKDQAELNDRIEKVSKYKKYIQLDIMDGVFVKNKSLMFNFKIPGQFKTEAHLMVVDPRAWIKKNSEKVNTVIVHKESPYFNECIQLSKAKKKKVGIALNPETSIKELATIQEKIDKVLIMAVHPGDYGNRFLPQMTKKIKELRHRFPDADIEVDGGVNDKTIKKLYLAGANKFIVGSFLQKSRDIEKSIEKLETALNNFPKEGL